MTSNSATTLWRHPPWALAALLAGLSALGPFAIDTYMPAFGGIAASLQATPAQMQQTLSAYLLGFAAMNLFHGAISDSLGRRRVVVSGLAVFTLATVGCAMSQSIGMLVAFRALQGMSAGAGSVVSRAIVRDLFPPDQAQRVMSKVTIFFGLAPVIAPILGGLVYVQLGWHAVFWLLTGIAATLLLVNARWLPESLPPAQRHPFELRPLLQGYGQLVGNPRFLALVVSSGVPFNGLFLYVLAAPVWLGTHLHLGPTQYFWFFTLEISGIMAGAWLSGRMAGRFPPRAQIRLGFGVMTVAVLINVAANLAFTAHAGWAFFPVTLYSLGWALTAPVITLMALDVVPTRRGTASSLQACVGSAANGLVAGVLVPLVMHSTVALACTSMAMLAVGLAAWVWVQRHPEAGAAHPVPREN